MKASFKYLAAGLAAAFLSIGAASAATVSCAGARIFIADTNPVATCYNSGAGFLGVGASDQVINGGPLTGLVVLDQFITAKGGTTAPTAPAVPTEAQPGALTITETGQIRPADGTFSFSSALASLYKNFIIMFKVGENNGNGNIDPDWAAFLLPATVFSGGFSVDSGYFANGKPAGYLIEARLYAQPIPLPAAGLLLLGALAGFGALARRRTAA